MADFTIKKGDLRPDIQATLYDASDTAINLSTASGVKFNMTNKATGVVKVNAAATIVTAASGIVKYEWTGTNTDTAGTYDIEWEITWTGGDIQTVPNDSHDELIVYTDLA